jgi:glycosyltransferase involved in cell wall biosynthesis
MITGIDNLSFSVIINTIDRAGPLHTLLQSLEHQSYPNFEVVVVVGPTNDNTIELLSEFDGRIRLIQCPVANLSRSRNLGLLAAHGDIIVYIDDDAVPCQRWLEQYAHIFTTQDIQVTGGAVWAAHPKFTMLQFRLGIYSSLAEQLDVRSSWIDQIVPPGIASRWIARIPGGNMAARREALLDVDGFDEFFEFVAEETDLSIRMVNANKRIYPVKEAVIYHFPASGRIRAAFTIKGKWWLRSRSRVYLGLKNGLSSGESLHNVILRTLRSAGANLPWYLSLLRENQLSFPEFVIMAANEVGAGLSGLIFGLFMPRQLIHSHDSEAAKGVSKPILKFQNQESLNQPSVDPVSGKKSNISMPDPPMRICLLSNTYPPATYGGIARLTNLMAKGLFDLGHTVHVITRGEREEVTFYDGAFVHKIPNLLNRYERYQSFFNLYTTLNYSHNVYEKVKRLILNDGIQIVDSPFWQYEGLVTLKSGIAPVVLRLVTGLRQITDIHKSRVAEFSLMGDLEQNFIEQAHFLLPNTLATLDAMRIVYDLKSTEKRYEIIPYGIVPAPDNQIFPFEPKSDNDTLTVLFVGRLEKRKGVLDLFEAIPTVLKRIPNARFFIAGKDNSNNDGFKMKTGMDYPTFFSSRYEAYLPFVEFLGEVSDEVLQNLYQACDLFVAPSLYESFGLIYLEAMNYAKPVIGCKAGGIPEVVDHGETGLLVEPGSSPALAEAILSLLKSPVKLREMGLAGRSQILERFNYIQMARNFERVYRQVINTFNDQELK